MRLSTERVDWKLDANGDLVVPIEYTTGVAAAAQGIRIRLLMFRGEWFRDRDKGVPWFDNDIVPAREAILGQVFDELRVRAAVRAAILDTTEDDLTVSSLGVSFDPTQRRVTITWTVIVRFRDLTESVSGSITREV